MNELRALSLCGSSSVGALTRRGSSSSPAGDRRLARRGCKWRHEIDGISRELGKGGSCSLSRRYVRGERDKGRNNGFNHNSAVKRVGRRDVGGARFIVRLCADFGRQLPTGWIKPANGGSLPTRRRRFHSASQPVSQRSPGQPERFATPLIYSAKIMAFRARRAAH